MNMVFGKSYWDRSISTELETWIRLHSEKLFSIAFSILHDEYLAQDCVQEAFIKAGLHANQLKDPDRLFAWLSRIVVNECRSQQRTGWIKRIIPRDTLDKVGQEDRYPTLLRCDLYRHVMKLPPKWEMAVLLFYYHDLPLSEVSAILRINESTCKVWLHRARLRLKKMIGDESS